MLIIRVPPVVDGESWLAVEGGGAEVEEEDAGAADELASLARARESALMDFSWRSECAAAAAAASRSAQSERLTNSNSALVTSVDGFLLLEPGVIRWASPSGEVTASSGLASSDTGVFAVSLNSCRFSATFRPFPGFTGCAGRGASIEGDELKDEDPDEFRLGSGRMARGLVGPVGRACFRVVVAAGRAAAAGRWVADKLGTAGRVSARGACLRRRCVDRLGERDGWGSSLPFGAELSELSSGAKTAEEADCLEGVSWRQESNLLEIARRKTSGVKIDDGSPSSAVLECEGDGWVGDVGESMRGEGGEVTVVELGGESG